MITGIIILLAAAIGTGIFFGIRAIARSRKARAQQKTLKWVICIEDATEVEEIASYYSLRLNRTAYAYEYGRDPLDDHERQAAAERKFADAKRQVASRRVKQKLGDSPEPYHVAAACLAVHNDKLDASLALTIEESELGALFVEAMSLTLDMVRQGDMVAMNGYKDAMADTRGIQHLCAKYGVPTPTYPGDWDDLVVKFIDNPSVEDFKNTPRLPVSAVRSMAGTAVVINDLKLAKLVLAYCLVQQVGYEAKSRQVIWPFRDAIGDVLLAELIKLVTQHKRTSSKRHTLR